LVVPDESTGAQPLDAGPIQKPGSVTEYPRDGETFVDRRLVLTFNLRGISHLALPLLLYGFRKENSRTLAALKRYVGRKTK
jgi:hypothetical protein